MAAIRTRRSLMLLFAAAFAFTLAFTLTADETTAGPGDCCTVKNAEQEIILAGWWNVEIYDCFCMWWDTLPPPPCDYLCPTPH